MTKEQAIVRMAIAINNTNFILKNYKANECGFNDALLYFKKGINKRHIAMYGL